MFRDEKLELKVGLFIGMGIFLMFLIVFSISDIYLLEKGYNLRSVFDYVNGLTEDSPIRYEGVHVGEVKKMDIFYDDADKKTRVMLDLWVRGDIRIEKDAIARINTLGLLGEQYLEITPGKEQSFMEPGGTVNSKNPVHVGEQMEGMVELVDSVKNIFKRVEEGEGTLGKLLSDPTLYDNLRAVSDKLAKGEGTIGKLLVEEKIYDDLEAFVADIKAHPWKLLSKPRTPRDRTATGEAEAVGGGKRDARRGVEVKR